MTPSVAKMLRRTALWRTAINFEKFAKWRGVDWVRPALPLNLEWRKELQEHAPIRPTIAARDLAAAMAEMLPRVAEPLFPRLPAPCVAVAPEPDLPDLPDYVPLKERDPVLWAQMSRAAGYRPCAGGCGEWLSDWQRDDKCDECWYSAAWQSVFGEAQNRPQRRVIWLAVAR